MQPDLAKRGIRFYNQYMSQALHLHRLQIVDSQVEQCQNRLKVIEVTLAENAALQAARADLAEAQKNYVNAEHNLKHADEEVNHQNIHIQQEEASLYSGLVKNPKELKDLQDELAALKRRLSVLEDQELEAMMQLDDFRSKLKSSEERMARAEAQASEKDAGLFSERTQAQKSIERLLSERTAILTIILPENLKTYERLRSQRKGNAVVEVIDKSCSACGATLTPAEWQAARSPDKLSFCPTCNRILYAG